jgi:hypothetical protein
LILLVTQTKLSNDTPNFQVAIRGELKGQFLAYPEMTNFLSLNLLALAARQTDSPEMLHTILKSEPFNIEEIWKDLRFCLLSV